VTPSLDDLFARAVTVIDRGDLTGLQQLLAQHPDLATARLESPGPWLRQAVGDALDGIFARPYLLWFVAEDPVRAGKLPTNIVDLARTIIEAARRHDAGSLQAQLDHALRLVAWSGVAAKAGVQIPLIDLLVAAGAAPAKNANNALVNHHLAAAERLIQLGGELTLGTAVCLDRWDAIPALFAAANERQRQFALVMAALNGRARSVSWLVEAGVPPNQPSQDLYAHGTPLHHAVCSGSLDAVKALVERGADPTIPDTAWNGTAIGWAEHYVEDGDPARRTEYTAVLDYLRSL
jgi:peptide-methionine (S)-S-oxide reductase